MEPSPLTVDLSIISQDKSSTFIEGFNLTKYKDRLETNRSQKSSSSLIYNESHNWINHNILGIKNCEEDYLTKHLHYLMNKRTHHGGPRNTITLSCEKSVITVYMKV